MDGVGLALRGSSLPARLAAPAPVTRPPSQNSLRRRLALMAAASIVPMLLLFAAQGYVAYRGERSRAGQRQLEVARSMAATVDHELEGAVASLQAIALSPRLQQNDMPGFRLLAMRFIAGQPAGSSMALLDRSGQALVSTRYPPGTPLPRRAPAVNDTLTKQVFETGHPVISNLFPRATDGSLIVTADVPVMVDGHVAYDLSLLLPAERFTHIIVEQHLEPGTISSIYDRNGMRVARQPDPQSFVGQAALPRLRAALMSAPEGVITSTSMEGTPLLSAFSHARMSGFSVTNGVPEATLERQLRMSLLQLVGAGLLGLACSLGVAAILAQRVLQPMRALARLASDPAALGESGDFGLIEVDETAQALRHSLAGRQAALEALQRLNESLEARVRHEIRNREQARSQLAQSQRMEALGQLAGGIAHDFNNVLQAVTGGLSLIQRRAGDPEAVRRLAHMAGDAAARGAAITGRLLTFARRGELSAVSVDAEVLLHSLREMLAHTLGANITVRVSVPPGLPPLLADRAQLETVLVNLAVNARDAMPEGGTLTLSAAAERSGDTAGGAPASLPRGDTIRLDLADTGSGMDATVLARASEPFFTTKPPGQGTGLGLAMARGFADQSGGALRIQSRPGEGTTITLWFPQAGTGPISVPPLADMVAEPAGAALRLLMVDDDSMVREILAHELEDRGFRVTTASDGLSALVLLDGGQPTDVLISDYAMPGMNGLTLIEEARRRRPDLPALLLTGYAEAETGLVVAPDALTVVLRKPVSGHDLAVQATGLSRKPPVGA